MRMFGKTFSDQFLLSPELEDQATAAILQSLKDGLPEKAHRLDVLCYLLDEAKRSVEARRVIL